MKRCSHNCPPGAPDNAAGQGGSTIRSQLLWASLFPLAFFGLLSTLVTSTALFR